MKRLKWPQYPEGMMSDIEKVFESNRYTISGYWTGAESFNEAFARQFAEYNGVKFCTTVSNASMGLLIALEALDIGYGDEVIVPALTWPATATSVINVNAVPVFADVDPDTYCIDPDKIESLITVRTRALIPVHLYGCMADMDRIMDIARKHGLKVIEDCAQNHGSLWNGKRAGTLGDIGVFSFEQSKALSAGEGGCAVTDDPELYSRLVQLAADSRVFNTRDMKYGDIPLTECGVVQGSNYKMTEMQAAMLSAQMKNFEEKNLARLKAAKYLDDRTSLIQGLKIMKRYDAIDQQSYFSYCVRVDSDYYGCATNDGVLMVRERILRKLRALLDFPPYFLHSSYAPVYLSKMFCPWTKRRYPKSVARTEEYWRSIRLHHSEKAVRESIVFHHAVLLRPESDLDIIVDALRTAAESVHPHRPERA